jgi:hypothetical protein
MPDSIAEQVDQLAHALRAGTLAVRVDSRPTLVAAALRHHDAAEGRATCTLDEVLDIVLAGARIVPAPVGDTTA